MDGISAVSSEMESTTLSEAYEMMLLKKAMYSETASAAELMLNMPDITPGADAAAPLPKGDYIDVFA